MITKLTVAMIIKNFKLNPDPRSSYPIKINPKLPLTESVDGCWVKIDKICRN